MSDKKEKKINEMLREIVNFMLENISQHLGERYFYYDELLKGRAYIGYTAHPNRMQDMSFADEGLAFQFPDNGIDYTMEFYFREGEFFKLRINTIHYTIFSKSKDFNIKTKNIDVIKEIQRHLKIIQNHKKQNDQ